LAALRAFPDIALIENALGGALDQLLDAGRTATVREWIDLATEHGGESSGIALRARAELALRAARGPEARVLGERAALRAADPEMAAKALLAAARGSHLAEDTPGLIKNAHAAARTSSDPTVQVLALWLAFVHAYEHEHPIGAQLLERLKRVAGPRTEDAIRVACGEAYLGLRNTGPTPALAAIAGHEALIDDIRDPLLRTNFLYVCSSLYVASAQYERGLLTAHRLREAADASGVGFAVDYSLLTAAAASVGMRQLGESQRYLKELRQRGSDNGHIRANATIIAAKARVAAGDLDAAGILLQQRPAAEVSRAMLAEHIANEALVLASLARHEEADRLLAEARGLSHDSEACTVALLASGVIGLRMRQDGQAARTAVREALNKGFLDAAAVASRAFPPLAKEAASSADLRPMLAALFAASRDVGLGRSAGLPMPRELQRSAGLSPREREVYDLVVLGRTNREIAKTLYISESTAKVHVRHILEKLGVHSRAEAAGVRDDPP
jgi:DNA-binding NarL/FixJ family response regulator